MVWWFRDTRSVGRQNYCLSTKPLRNYYCCLDLLYPAVSLFALFLFFNSMNHLLHILDVLKQFIFSVIFFMAIVAYSQSAENVMTDYLVSVNSKFFICHASGDATEKSCIANLHEYNTDIIDSMTLAYFLIFDPDDKVYMLFYLTWLDHILNENMSSALNTQCPDKKSSTTRNFNHFIIQFTGEYPSSVELKQHIKDIIVQLPVNTAFVIINCSPSFPYYNPELILEARRLAGFGSNNVLIHLNHEQPGSDSRDPAHHSNHCYGDSARLSELYAQFNLVIRNYYYEPFDNSTLYLPLGPTFLQLLNKLLEYPEYALLRSSERNVQCYFMGRSSYPHSGAHQVERAEIVQLHSQGKFPCRYEYFEADGINYYEYQKDMRGAVFAPAPAGNTYETFRLYEALELGCIPIIMVPGKQDSNYLLYKDWVDYPGPVLQSWSELEQFMREQYPTSTDGTLSWEQQQELDSLQERVMAWYISFKQKKGTELGAAIRKVLHNH